jgi:hypothetical protein
MIECTIELKDGREIYLEVSISKGRAGTREDPPEPQSMDIETAVWTETNVDLTPKQIEKYLNSDEVYDKIYQALEDEEGEADYDAYLEAEADRDDEYADYLDRTL